MKDCVEGLFAWPNGYIIEFLCNGINFLCKADPDNALVNQPHVHQYFTNDLGLNFDRYLPHLEGDVGPLRSFHVGPECRVASIWGVSSDGSSADISRGTVSAVLNILNLDPADAAELGVENDGRDLSKILFRWYDLLYFEIEITEQYGVAFTPSLLVGVLFFMFGISLILYGLVNSISMLSLDDLDKSYEPLDKLNGQELGSCYNFLRATVAAQQPPNNTTSESQQLKLYDGLVDILSLELPTQPVNHPARVNRANTKSKEKQEALPPIDLSTLRDLVSRPVSYSQMCVSHSFPPLNAYELKKWYVDKLTHKLFVDFCAQQKTKAANTIKSSFKCFKARKKVKMLRDEKPPLSPAEKFASAMYTARLFPECMGPVRASKLALMVSAREECPQITC